MILYNILVQTNIKQNFIFLINHFGFNFLEKYEEAFFYQKKKI